MISLVISSTCALKHIIYNISIAILSGAASMKCFARDTQQAPSTTTPSHIILTPGQPVALTTYADHQARQKQLTVSLV